MAVWVEAWYNGWFACVREQQNAYGAYDGIKLVRMIFQVVCKLRKQEPGIFTIPFF